MHYSKVFLRNFGYELPPNIMSSAELEALLSPVYTRLKLPQGRLELMSGIQERRFWDAGTLPSKGAALAGEKALASSGLAPDDIDCLIFTSVCRDLMEPATAAFVHNHLGLTDKCHIFDLSNACLGFLNGMIVLANMIELGQVRHGLVVAGETAEDLMKSTINNLLEDETLTRKKIKSSFASLTIGSGAVALAMSCEPLDSPHRLIGGVSRANTKHNDLCRGGNSTDDILMITDSEKLLEMGVETASLLWQDFLQELNWHPDYIKRFFCHQVGRAHAKLLTETLGIDSDKNFETLSFLGNVGSVSAPITMAIGVEKGELAPGEKAAVLGIGSGINCLMLGIEW